MSVCDGACNDYGVGNVGSIRKMLLKSGAEVAVSADPAVLERADCVVLPGVGAFDDAMERLLSTALVPLLERRVREAPHYPPRDLAHDREYVLKKLGFSKEEFDRMMAEPPHPHHDYPSDTAYIVPLMKANHLRRRLMGKGPQS